MSNLIKLVFGSINLNKDVLKHHWYEELNSKLLYMSIQILIMSCTFQS